MCEGSRTESDQHLILIVFHENSRSAFIGTLRCAHLMYSAWDRPTKDKRQAVLIRAEAEFLQVAFCVIVASRLHGA